MTRGRSPLFPPASLVAWGIALAVVSARAGEPAPTRPDDEFRQRIRPLVRKFCWECHSTEEQEGEVDLEKFATSAEVRRGRRTWHKVVEALDKGEMPPEDAPQPSAGERKTLRDWVGGVLDADARANAGDPGRVVLRRLSNVEYSNTLRDLTGVDLRPAREFPVDGAAGEGFTNAGEALVMSPSLLTKYLDAGKEIAAHAVLLPEGFRFAPAATRPDWTDEIVGEIRRFYARFAAGDNLPLESYLTATLDLRDARSAGKPLDIDAAAKGRGLSPKYLRTLWQFFAEAGPAGVAGGRRGLIDDLRDRWQAAGPGGAGPLAAEIGRWQAIAWKTNSVGSNFKPWKEPVDPVVESVGLRLPLKPPPGAGEVVLYLAAGAAGDGTDGDLATWRQPRLEAPGLPSLPLRDVDKVARYAAARRRQVLDATPRYLAAVAELPAGGDEVAVAALAGRHGLDADALSAWLDVLGITPGSANRIDGYLTRRLGAAGAVPSGWGEDATPNFLANPTAKEARIPGLLKAHGVAVHPSPDRLVAVAWRSPVAARVRLAAKVIDADPACGNGVTWSLDLRSGGGSRRLAAGAIENSKGATIDPIDGLDVRPGDLVTLRIGPRDGLHACDLTEIDLDITIPGADGRRWGLAGDVADDVQAGNPHADRQGNPNVWHFFAEPVTPGAATGPAIPAGSLLARWRDAKPVEEKGRLADDLRRLLTADGPAAGPDATLRRTLTAFGGPLLGRITAAARANPAALPDVPVDGSPPWGLDPARFGKQPDGTAIDAASLCVRAPSVLEVRLPAEFVAGQELVATGELEPGAGAGGSVQFLLTADRPRETARLLPGVPIVARKGSRGRERIDGGFDEFRGLFPGGACYSRVVPVDEVITIVLFHRDDEALCRLALDEAQRAELDRLWADLRFVSQDALKINQSFPLMIGFASQEGRADEFRPMQKQVAARAEAFQARLVAAEPAQLAELLKFAARAFRRPLADGEAQGLRAVYRDLREEGLAHDEAFRLVLARVLVSPAFLYRVEKPGAGSRAVSDWELATRLSYFLWASTPDDELRRLAGEGRLRDPAVLDGQARRLLRDDRARGLATEFACQWLDIRDFDRLDEKSERHFPTFADVRGDLYEESIRVFEDLFRRDGSLLELIDSDHTFLNESLARFYGIPGVTGPAWRRVDGVRARGRGGVLGLGTTLAKQSGASRTSPILRGNWIVETLLGERLPRPPKGVPQLPDDEAATDGLTVRQLVEKHENAAQCASCHHRIDPFGFALEGFDAIGRLRTKDLGDRPLDTRAKLKDGTTFEGIAGLRDYLLTQRKDQILRNFCRKLLGYALGRATQPSDGPLVEEMLGRLKGEGYRFSAALGAILQSKQFREHRGLGDDHDQE